MARFLLLQSYPESTVPMANKVLLESVANGSNVVISPLSFQAGLSFVALGSSGPTLKQFLQFLGSSSVGELHSLCKQTANLTLPVETSAFNSFGAPVLLEFTNATWIHEDFSFKPSFEGIVRDLYEVESKTINHGDQVDEIMGQINGWAANVSKGLITQLLPQDSLSNKPALVLANALYFKGKWAQNFDKFSSQQKNFNLLSGGCVSAPFMTSKQRSRFFQQLNGFKVLSLPYQNGTDTRRFSMHIFLPDTSNGLPNLIQNLNDDPGFLTKLELRLEQVELNEFWVPKFKFSFDFEASQTLKGMGLTLPFQESNQDFSKMAVSHKGCPPYLSKAFHKAHFEVDEEGTDTSPFTTSVFQRPNIRTPQRPSTSSFVADHPFFFMIREETSRTVFFTGAVLNPVAKAEPPSPAGFFFNPSSNPHHIPPIPGSSSPFFTTPVSVPTFQPSILFTCAQ